MSVDEPAEQRGTRASQKCGNLGVAAAAGLWRQTADFNGMHQHLPPHPPRSTCWVEALIKGRTCESRRTANTSVNDIWCLRISVPPAAAAAGGTWQMWRRAEPTDV